MNNIFIKTLLFLAFFGTSEYMSSQNITYPDGVTYIYEYTGSNISSDAPRVVGTTYRIDVITIPFFDKKDPAIRDLSKVNKTYKEYWHNQNNFHLLVGTYHDYEEAKKQLKIVKKKGFSSAHIVTYENGLRK